MIRSIVKLGIVLVIGILVYNFFFGSPEEKDSSRRIFTEIKDVGVAVGDLLKNEKEKFDKGKYDDALTKIEDVFGKMKERARELNDNELLDKISRLERQREQISEEIEEAVERPQQEFTTKSPESYDAPVVSKKDERKIKRDLDNLMEETKEVVRQMDMKEE